MPSSDGGADRPSRPLPVVLGLSLLGGAVLLGYLITLGGGFYYDDIALIVTNPYIRDFSHLPTILAAGRPMRALTFMLNYAFVELEPFQYHFTNIALHYLTALLVYALARRLTRTVAPAMMAAWLFALHPVHTEAVAAISHRKESLAAIFTLLTLLSAMRARTAPRRAWLWWLGAGVALGLGYLSKQTALTAPLLLWICERHRAKNLGVAPAPPRLRLVLALGIGAPVALLALLTVFGSYGDFTPFAYFPVDNLFTTAHRELLLTSVRAAAAYLGLVLWPLHLTVDHFVARSTSLFEADVLLAAGVLGAATWGAVVLGRRIPLAGVGAAWFAITLLPLLNIIPANFILAERYLYVPWIGGALVWAAICERLDAGALATGNGSMTSATTHARVGSLLLVVLGVLVFFGPLPTLLRNQTVDHEAARPGVLLFGTLAATGLGYLLVRLWRGAWQSPERPLPPLTRSLLVLVPALLVAYAGILAGAAALAGPDARGASPLPYFFSPSYAGHFEATVEFYTTQPWTHGLPPGASLWAAVRKTLIFLASFTIAPALGAHYMLRFLVRRRRRGAAFPTGSLLALVLGYCYLALLIPQTSKWVTSYKLWRSTVQENPYSYRAHNNLAVYLRERGRIDDAVRHYRRAAQLRPERAEPSYNLGIALLLTQQFTEAHAAFEAAVRADPRSVDALINLGNLDRIAGNTEVARTWYERAVAASPPNAPSLRAYLNLAGLYGEIGRRDKQAEACAILLRERPEWIEAREACAPSPPPPSPALADSPAHSSRQ